MAGEGRAARAAGAAGAARAAKAKWSARVKWRAADEFPLGRAGVAEQGWLADSARI